MLFVVFIYSVSKLSILPRLRLGQGALNRLVTRVASVMAYASVWSGESFKNESTHSHQLDFASRFFLVRQVDITL